MNLKMIIMLILFALVVVLFGYANYKSAMEKGKEMYCDTKKDGEECDFLDKDK